MSGSRPLHAAWLGRTGYVDGWRTQEAVAARLAAETRRASASSADLASLSAASAAVASPGMSPVDTSMSSIPRCGVSPGRLSPCCG